MREEKVIITENQETNLNKLKETCSNMKCFELKAFERIIKNLKTLNELEESELAFYKKKDKILNELKSDNIILKEYASYYNNYIEAGREDTEVIKHAREIILNWTKKCEKFYEEETKTTGRKLRYLLLEKVQKNKYNYI